MTPPRPAEPFRPVGAHFELELTGARALFTTRRGGFSEGPFDSLNLGVLTEDRPEAVEDNRRLLEAEVGRSVCFVRQVHGASVRELRADDAQAIRESRPDQLPHADGQVTVTPGVAAAVLAADCLPVIVAGTGGVAVLHAGWPGLKANIIAEGVRALRERGVGGRLEAAIGPGAGPCCYEVGDDVRSAFAGYPEHIHRGDNLDLPAIARVQLEAAGVAEVHNIGLCTICSDPSLLFSHRRDHGVTGRQAGVAWLI